MKFFSFISEKVEDFFEPNFKIGEIVYAPFMNPTTKEVTYKKAPIVSCNDRGNGYFDYLVEMDGKIVQYYERGLFPVEEPKPKRGRPKKGE